MDEIISFEDLGLDEISLEAVKNKGFETPSPIQTLAIPRLLQGEANVIAKARTGTGKTAAFGLPLAQKIREDNGNVRAIVLTPTRELALQVCKEIDSLHTGKFPRLTAVYGGQGYGEQFRALKKGVDIVVGTPGRIQDHLERGSLDISKIDYFILDEADEMLDMGFIEDIEAIFAQANPDSRILLFSATMPQPILKIAAKFMGDYEIVQEEATPETPILTEQKYMFLKEKDKLEAVVRIIDISPDFYGLIFTQTKLDADTLTRQLDERGYEVAALHGDISQMQREKILYRFRIKKTRILVATDVAARGIDIEGLSHVINYSLPFDSSTYIHRIGRTGRAGAKGIAITLVRPEERRKLEYIKATIRKGVKGSLEEMKIPSVKEVLEIKKERLFSSVKESIEKGFSFDKEESADIFERMADDLCEEKSAQEVLASILKSFYGRQLDPARYGEITQIPVRNNTERKNASFSSNSKQIRIYVQLGKKDNFHVREIADFFADLLNIPSRQVDKIDVSEKFSLVSLPREAALTALDLSKKNRSLPHMHIDSKSGDFNAPKNFKGGSSKPKSFTERNDRRNFSDSKRENKKGSIRNANTSGASLYKRKQPSGKQ